MIRIEARILHRSVFIPEEKIICEIVFTNMAKKDHVTAAKQLSHQRHSSDTRVLAPERWSKNMIMDAKVSNDQSVTVAYASAQLYCQCNLNERKYRMPLNAISNKNERSTRHTSFSPDQGNVLSSCFKFLEEPSNQSQNLIAF